MVKQMVIAASFLRFLLFQHKKYSDVFIVIGNYLPKIQRNPTVGIRIPWTLSDDKNWYKTHRMTGKLWVIGGLIILLESFIQVALPYVMGVVIAVMIVGPIVYSFILSRKNSL